MNLTDETLPADHPDSLLNGMISAADLDTMTFPPLIEHVPRLITEGFGILAGAPKAGKSWLTAGLALSCASGGKALGRIDVEPRAVLLMALEDGHRRLKDRMRKLTCGQPLPPRLDILTQIHPGTANATMTEWLQRHSSDPNPPLLILDTLGRARPQRRPGDDPYIADYQLGARIKTTVDQVPGAALVAVHHTRKLAADDWLDTLSGTQGIAGSADYVMVLRRQRKSDDGTLAVTGRDVAENEYAVTVTDGLWQLAGGGLTESAAAAEIRRQEQNLGERARDVLAVVTHRAANGQVTTAADVAQKIAVQQNQARVYLNRLADSGRIVKTTTGVYTTAVTTVTAVTPDMYANNT